MENLNRLLYTIIFSLLFLFGSVLFAETNLSLQTRILLDWQSSESQRARAENDSDDSQLVHLFLVVTDDFDRSSLDTLNAFIESDFGTTVTLTIPIQQLQSLTELKNIEYVRVGMPVKPRLDVAVPEIGADNVLQGIGINRAYTGEGVIVGVVDFGLDFTHPTFLNADGSLKISRCWVQSESRGNAPQGFSYGREYVGEAALLTKQYTNNDLSHGTHVSGIIAGSGSSGLYSGVAPDAEIVFVETGGKDAQIIDAVKYIFQYAKSVNKPAVVNLSLGSLSGPRDGTSLVDRGFDNLINQFGPGKIIVGAVGNEGDLKLHIMQHFSGATDTLRSIVQMSRKTQDTNVDIWGDANTSIDVAVEVYDLNTKRVIHSTPFGNTSSGYRTERKWTVAGHTIEVRLSSQAKFVTNHKPNIELYIKNPVYNEYGVAVLLKGKAEQRVDLWNAGDNYGEEFHALLGTTTTGWVWGTSDGSMGEVGGTGKNTISVGSYTTKKSWTDLSGQLRISVGTIGEISYFSSLGPTVDWRTKPDITAPGAMLVSSVNSFDTRYQPNGASRQYLVHEQGSHYYAIMQGTSMAAPMVSGAVALMLQKNSGLTPDEVKSLLKKYAVQDEKTGIIDDFGSNIWGFGKLNIYDIMRSQEINIIPQLSNLRIAYNPQTKEVILQTKEEYNGDTIFELEIDRVQFFDITGRKLMDLENVSERRIDVSRFRAGIVIVKVFSGKEHAKAKMVIY